MKLLRVHCHSESGENISVYSLEIHPEMVEILQELGILDTRKNLISQEELLRIKKIMRLKNVLGVNIKGAAIIAELLERIEELQDEIKRLEKERGL